MSKTCACVVTSDLQTQTNQSEREESTGNATRGSAAHACMRERGVLRMRRDLDLDAACVLLLHPDGAASPRLGAVATVRDRTRAAARHRQTLQPSQTEPRDAVSQRAALKQSTNLARVFYCNTSKVRFSRCFFFFSGTRTRASPVFTIASLTSRRTRHTAQSHS